MMDALQLISELTAAAADTPVRIVTATLEEYRVSSVQVEVYPDGTSDIVLYTSDSIPSPEVR